MPRRAARGRRAHKPPRRRSRRSRASASLRRKLPSKRTRKRWWRAWQRLSPVVQWPAALLAVVMLWLAVNAVYQVARKPTELFFPISGALHKSPTATWRAYATLFRRHATPLITPDLLAALAQVEGAGNPVARTYWRWSLSFDPFAIYRPASSSVGMYQISDGTFAEARRFCVHDHVVVEEGAWNDWRSCWLNALYTRVIPSHAIELTSAYLDHHVRWALRRHPAPRASLRDKQRLAAVIHLCGAGAGRGFARRGFGLEPGQRCGTHDVRRYLEKVERQQVGFRQLEIASR